MGALFLRPRFAAWGIQRRLTALAPGIPEVLQRIDGRHVLGYSEREPWIKRQHYCLFKLFFNSAMPEDSD
jgi:hypothetical protein